MMARDPGVILINDDESDTKEHLFSDEEESEDGQEEEEPEIQWEEPDHGVQSDMARFPGKTRKEVILAKSLWDSNSIHIHNENEVDSAKVNFYISRDLLCSVSGRIRTLSPTSRSWPILNWDDVVGERFDPTDLWLFMPGFVEFLHTSTRHLDEDIDLDDWYNMEWRLGAALEAPKFQNLVLKEKFLLDNDYETEFAVGDRETLDTIYEVDARQLENIGIKLTGRAKFEKHNLARYMLDKLIWDTVDGGEVWLRIVHRGGCIANVVAQSQVKAAKKPAPRFPPWHVFNRYKYLLDEETTPATPAPKRAGGILASPPPKRAARGP